MSASSMLDLRPLTVGEILDRAFRLYRNNFLKFLGIVAVTQVPASLLGLLVTATLTTEQTFNPSTFTPNTATQIGTPIAAAFIVALLSFVLTQVSTAALTEAISAKYLGEDLSISESFRRIGRSWVALIKALIMGGLVSFGLAFPLAIPCINIVLALPLVGALVYLSQVVLQLLPPIVVLEKHRSLRSIYRAWHLSRARFWPTLGFMLALSLLVTLVTAGPVFLILFLIETAVPLSATTSNIIQQATSLLFTTIVLPLQLTSITLLYFDLRVRHEGFDLKLMTAQLEDTEEAVNRDVLTAEVPKSAFQPTGQEIGNFCLITIGVVVLVGGFSLLAPGLLTLFTGF